MCEFKDCVNFEEKCSICKYFNNSFQLNFYCPKSLESNKPVIKVCHKSDFNYKDGIRAERQIANKYDGRLVVASGSLSGQVYSLCGDVVLPKENVLIQSKTRSEKNATNIRIHKKDIEKHWDEARRVGRTPAVFISFYNKHKFWAIYVNSEDSRNLIQYTASVASFNITEEMLKRPFCFKFKYCDCIYIVDTADDFMLYLHNERKKCNE